WSARVDRAGAGALTGALRAQFAVRMAATTSPCLNIRTRAPELALLAVVGRRPRELAGLAEPPQIGGHDCCHGEWLDAEGLQRAAFALGLLRDDDVAAQQFDLIGRQEWLRQQLKEDG